MLQPRNFFLFTLAAVLALGSPKASAGLLGFSSSDTPSPEEEILNIDVPPLYVPNYRASMRDNLLMLIDYAKAQNPDFIFVAHQGDELLNRSLWELHLEGYNQARRQNTRAEDPAFLDFKKDQKEENFPAENTPAHRYLHSIDGIALNSLYCGKNQISPLITAAGLPVIAIDRCPDDDSFDRAIIRSIMDRRPLYGFINDNLAFNNIKNQPVINESAKNIMDIPSVRNVLFLLDDSRFATRYDFINALNRTNYDLVVINPLFHNKEPFTKDEIRSMQFKKNGTKRILLAEMNVSEANPARYYWNPRWKIGNPRWLVETSPSGSGNIITRYWDSAWQQILSKHFKDIVGNGYDGVFFTGIDNHKFFEKQTPLE